MTTARDADGAATPRARRRPTATSSFGVSRRESHDSAGFYARFAPPVVSDEADVSDADRAVDEIFCGDSRAMDRVPDRSVALMVTSPPYFAGKEYEEALGQGHVPGSYLDFLRMLEDVFAECTRKLEPGGRMAVNVANLGRRPYRSLSADVVTILQDRLRLLLRGEIIWQKARGSAGSCAWGSFQRPANPVLRDLTERVVVASKGRFDRALSPAERARRGLPSVGSMSRDHFMALTTDVWELPAESATRVGHPAPFPVELPERLIHLYTYYGDLVLDPMMGGGATAVAAVRTGRHFVGYDTDPGYVERARERVRAEQARLPVGPIDGSPEVRLEARRGRRRDDPPAPGADPVDEALAAGAAARDVARALLAACGFHAVEDAPRLPAGVDVTFRATDASGRPWLFELVGAFSSARPGLRRTDSMWKALGKAAVLHSLGAPPLVLLTTDLPASGSRGDSALRAATGPSKPVAAVVRLTDRSDRTRLRQLATTPSG